MPINIRQKNAAIKKQLTKRLKLSLIGIFLFIFIAIVAINFFGPQIGALFGFISVHRNELQKTAKVNLFTPVITDLPTSTNSREISVQGYANGGVNIKIFINGPEKSQTTVGEDGKFKFEKISLINGRNTVFVKSEDPQTESSIKSDTYIVVLDTQKPKLEIAEPAEGATIRNLNNRITITGRVNEKAIVTINEKQAVLKPDLSFEFQLGVKEGGVEIKTKAVDEAGNEQEEILKVRYVKGSQ